MCLIWHDTDQGLGGGDNYTYHRESARYCQAVDAAIIDWLLCGAAYEVCRSGDND